MVMEYGAVESWVKKYNMGAYLPRGLEQDKSFKDSKFYLNSGFVKVLCLLKNGETLLEYECRALVSSDPKHGTFKDLMSHGVPGLSEAVLHVGNLRWIDSVTETWCAEKQEFASHKLCLLCSFCYCCCPCVCLELCYCVKSQICDPSFGACQLYHQFGVGLYIANHFIYGKILYLSSIFYRKHIETEWIFY